MPDPIETGAVRGTDTHNHHHTSEHPAVVDQTEARQGSRRLDNMRVLVISLAILAIVGGGLYVYW